MLLGSSNFVMYPQELLTRYVVSILTEQMMPRDIARDTYMIEFLGLNSNAA